MQPHLAAAQQYFPKYRIDLEREEIVLREYDLAAKALEGDQRSLSAAAGIALFFSGGLATLAGSGSGTRQLAALIGSIGAQAILASIGLVYVVAILSIHYFSQLQRSATHAARKIVVLRRLLGVDYGAIETVLPADQLDGANEPFSIEMFAGWGSIAAIPTIAVALIAGATQALLLIALGITADPLWLAGAGALFTLLLLGIYRLALLERFETPRSLAAKAIGALAGVPLKRRTGHILYHMRLSVFEAERLGVDLGAMHRLLVYIEDRDYHRHGGNSVRALAAAFYRYARYRRRSGGSTIYQQLARSNFLTRLDRPVGRKLLEWWLAPWLHGLATKAEGLNLYLGSVRFARGVVGLPAAIRHFFPRHNLKRPLSAAQRFLLIERLSNVSGTYPTARVARLARQAVSAGLLAAADLAELERLYRRQIADGRIRSDTPPAIRPA